ncbi:MAG: hypothetical protein JNJ61_10800 [Anaerolineae bacterium]|nr:hypothetical protein [Anaerolineae bacterium]
MTVLTITATKVRPLQQQGCIVIPSFRAAEAMTVGDVVYVSDATNRKVTRTDADTLATVRGMVYLVVAGGRHKTDGAIAIDEAVDLVEFGPVNLGATLDVTKTYYASNTTGKIDDAPGTSVRRLGYARDTEVFFFNPMVAPAGS